MSLTGVLNTHMIAATLLRATAARSKGGGCCRHGERERRGALSLSEADAGSDTRAIRVPGGARRRRVRHQRHEVVGHQWRASWLGRPGSPHPGGHYVLHRREGAGPALRGNHSLRDISASSATGASRRWRWSTSTTGSRPAVLVVERLGQGLPQILGALELGRINIAARASEWPGPPSRRRSPTPSNGRPSACRSPSTRRSLKLADMATKLEAARLLTRNAAEASSTGSAATWKRAWPSCSPPRPPSKSPPRPCASTAVRLHDRTAGRAILPGRPAPDDRRGHQRDPAPRHRTRPAGGPAVGP